MAHRIEVAWQPTAGDVRAERALPLFRRLLGEELEVRSALVYRLGVDLPAEALARAAACLHDPVAQRAVVDGAVFEAPAACVEVGYKPGVTDNTGRTAGEVLRTALPEAWPADAKVYTSVLYGLFGRLEGPLPAGEELLAAGGPALLGNPLIQSCTAARGEAWDPAAIPLPRVAIAPHLDAESFDLFQPVAALEALSQRHVWSLSVRELVAIREHFARPEVRAGREAHGLAAPTRCELEILAQTWSEHCKHKEFNARILVRDRRDGSSREVDGLFRSYIRAATAEIRARLEARGDSWLIKVFDDNAGIVRFSDSQNFVFKVETHNSPSALEPYGGALTGLVGVHRDPGGTGRTGAQLLFNVDIFCLAPPDFPGPLLPGMLPPKAVFEGVRQGVEDGGNQSGVPTINGSLVFDARFRGKPLIFCGAGGLMPAELGGEQTSHKRIEPGQLIVMAGGRVGADGIHGATFSSMEIDDSSPATAVQIGDPITQKRTLDFLREAAGAGWLRGVTDNGAGGLSSSIGELASQPGGAEVWLEKVPLKYPGLAPWEIFVSESQERMTLAVRPEDLEPLAALAARRDVELSVVGRFTAGPELLVKYEEQVYACLGMDFLHDGVPRKVLEAELLPPPRDRRLPGEVDLSAMLHTVLARLNVCSREPVIRRYDHEVKGRTALKPLCGPNMDGHMDAAVICPDFATPHVGIAVANGICPRYGDIDAFRMAQGAVDEAVRQIVAVGGRLPDFATPGLDMWSLNDNFCVPDSAWHPVKNPDGREKLGKLVQMCEGLYEAVVAYGTPLTSGKDSMKNDFARGGEKVSVPPTLLVTATARIPDVRRCVSADFKVPGERVYILGETGEHLARSEYFDALGLDGLEVSPVDLERARTRYGALADAIAQGLVRSCHDCSDGGLAVALCESAIGGACGVEVELAALPYVGRRRPDLMLFAETHSRFVVSVREADAAAFEACFSDACACIGRVLEEPVVRVRGIEHELLIEAPLASLREAWKRTLSWI